MISAVSKRALAAYDLRSTAPRPKLWEIAQQLKLGKGNQLLTKEEIAARVKTPTIKDKKISLQIAASKKIHHAEKIIEGVAGGVFPAISTDKKSNRRA
jgi:hypothetical protein